MHHAVRRLLVETGEKLDERLIEDYREHQGDAVASAMLNAFHGWLGGGPAYEEVYVDIR